MCGLKNSKVYFVEFYEREVVVVRILQRPVLKGIG